VVSRRVAARSNRNHACAAGSIESGTSLAT
jgi:hypothetical protein